MDPEQWRTEHTNIQGMPGPLDLRRMCNHLAKKAIMVCSAPIFRRAKQSKKSVTYPGGRRTITNAVTSQLPASQVGDRAKQLGDQK